MDEQFHRRADEEVVSVGHVCGVIGHEADAEERCEEDEGGVEAVDVATDASEILLCAQVLSNGLGRARPVRWDRGSHRPPALDELGITAHGHLERNDPLAKGRQPLKCCREVADECSLPRLLRQGGDLGDGSRGGVRVPDLSYDILRRRDEVGSGRYTAFGQGGHVCIGGRG